MSGIKYVLYSVIHARAFVWYEVSHSFKVIYDLNSGDNYG